MSRRLTMLLATLATSLAALVPLPAQAWDDPPGISFFYPLLTRRPVIEREVEFTVNHEKGQDGRVTEAAAALEFPILPRWQVELEVPLIFLHEKERTAQGGIGDIELQTKVLVFDSIDPPALVAVGVEGRLPTGSERRGLGGEAAIQPFISAGVALGPFDVLAEIAYEWNLNSHVHGPREQELTAGAAPRRRAHPQVAPPLALAPGAPTPRPHHEDPGPPTQGVHPPGANPAPPP